MAHKSRYIAGKKKAQTASQNTSRAAKPAEIKAETLIARTPAPAPKPAGAAAVPAEVKYANLPRDLRQQAMLAGLILILLFVAWMILK